MISNVLRIKLSRCWIALVFGSSTERVIELQKRLLHIDCGRQTTCARSADSNSSSIEHTRKIWMTLTPSPTLFIFGVNRILSSWTGHWQMKALLKEVSSLHIVQPAVNLLTSSNLKCKRIGYPLIKVGYLDGRWFTCICVHVYMYVGLHVHNSFRSKGWQTCLAVVNNPWPCIKLIWYDNKANKCIRICQSVTYYVIQIVRFLHVLASLRWP